MITTLTELSINADHRYLSLVAPWITAFVERVPEPIANRETVGSELALAMHELVANQIDHAYESSGGRITLSIEYDAKHRAIMTQTQDWGRSLNTKDLPHTTWRETTVGLQLVSVAEPEWDQVRGRGLFLVHNLTNYVSYQSHAKHNIWTVTKSIQSP